MEYKVELNLFIDEDKVRTKKEMKQIIKSIFDNYNCEATNIKVDIDWCEHDWHIHGMTIIDTEILNCQPCYEVKYVCSQCGQIKYVKE